MFMILSNSLSLSLFLISARHALIVLLFSGKTAHVGDDHSVLARWDRRFALTFVLYISALVPACLFDDLGSILALTGAIAGSSLSYVGPGSAYLGIHGALFLKKVQQSWWNTIDDNEKKYLWIYPCREGMGVVVDEIVSRSSGGNSHQEETFEGNRRKKQSHWAVSFFGVGAWYILFMPLWCFIATIGDKNYKEFQEKQATTTSPKSFEKKGSETKTKTAGRQKQRSFSHSSSLLKNVVESGFYLDDDSIIAMPGALVASSHKVYGSINDDCNAEKQERARNSSPTANITSVNEEKDNQEKVTPTTSDFLLAILYIILGAVALVAGIVSITSQEKT